jgi:integrase/recombinase XerD
VTRATRGPGRPALIELSPPATVDEHGRIRGEVAAAFEEWLQVRQASNRITSDRTVDGYRADMARWATLLAAPGDGAALDRWALMDLNDRSIQRALVEMNKVGLSASARQRALAPLRGLCRWLVRNERLPADPTIDEDLTVRSSPRRLPSAFSVAELARITTVVRSGVSGQREALRWPERDLATLALLAGCGLRSSELCGLTWAALPDLDQTEPGVRVLGKGARERRVPVAPRIAETIRAYRDARAASSHRGPLAVRPHTQVIVRVDGRPLTPSVLTEWVRRWLLEAQVQRRPGALSHAFRHTAADGWLANGATLAEVQALLGHASIGTTGIYTKVRPETLVAVVKAGRLEELLAAPEAGATPRRSDRAG